MEDTTKKRWGQKIGSIKQRKEHAARVWVRGVRKWMHGADANIIYECVSKDRITKKIWPYGSQNVWTQNASSHWDTLATHN